MAYSAIDNYYQW